LVERRIQGAFPTLPSPAASGSPSKLPFGKYGQLFAGRCPETLQLNLAHHIKPLPEVEGSRADCGREAAALSAGAAAPAFPWASTESSRHGDELKAAASRPQSKALRAF